MTKIKQLSEIFKDKNLLKVALTHRSWLNEHTNENQNNERLEFLGDAILEFVTSSVLYNSYPNKEEGYLTALRANLVNTTSLFNVADKLKLGELLRLSKGEEETGGRNNPSLLADTLEAVIGAIYLDRGISEASDFIKENILYDMEIIAQKPLKDFKSRLQEIVQAKGMPTPRYKVANESGPDHLKTFEIEVIVNGDIVATGKGKSKSEAEQKAAQEALAKFL